MIETQPPVFTAIPALSGISQDSANLTVALDKPGRVHYWIQYQSMMYVNQNGFAHSYHMMMPEAKQMALVEAQAYQGGIVANGTIELQYQGETVEHTIHPSCIGSACDYSQSALFPSTQYQV